MIDMSEFEQEFVPVIPGHIRKATPVADGRHRGQGRAQHPASTWVMLAVWVAALTLFAAAIIMLGALIHEPVGDQAVPHPINVHTIAPPPSPH